MNSNRKGKEGERELANLLKEYGYGCRRGQQLGNCTLLWLMESCQ